MAAYPDKTRVLKTTMALYGYENGKDISKPLINPIREIKNIFRLYVI